MALLLGRASPGSRPLSGLSTWQRHGGAPAPGTGAQAPPRGAAPALPARTDVVVVGGGLAGLSTALALVEADPGVGVVVVEARFVGFGASGRNAGLLSPLPAPVWLVTADSNAEHLWALAHLNRRAREIGRRLSIEMPECRAEPRSLRIEAQGLLTAIGLANVARRIEKAGIELRTAAGPGGHLAVDLDTHALDPYRTVLALAAAARRRGVAIAEDCPVLGLDETPDSVQVEIVGGRRITARAAVVCTNAYSGSLRLPEPPAAKLVYNFMVATTPLAETVEQARPGLSSRFVVELNTSYVFYRAAGDRLIYGGIERFKPFGQDDFSVPPDVLAGLERLIGRSFPGAGLMPAEAWGGAYHQTTTDLPIIRQTGSRGSIVLNVGYGGTGVAMTMACAPIAAALALGRSPADPDHARLHAALTGTRLPVGGLARFIAGVAGDVLMLRRPRPGA